jgi:SAM-dependent methyltransferase
MIPHRRIATSNSMGWSSNILNELSEKFVESCAPGLTALDIGAAIGVATLPALAAGAKVHANDSSSDHLAHLASLVPEGSKHRLTLHPGRFPKDLKLPAESIDLAHASNVFHFLTGRQLELGAALLHRLLRPDGQLFVLAATPYMAPFSSFIPTFEATQSQWPGWIENTRQVSQHRLLDQLPKSILLLDDKVLQRVFTEAGFRIDDCWMFRRRDLPKSIQWDGRENVALIARKA